MPLLKLYKPFLFSLAAPALGVQSYPWTETFRSLTGSPGCAPLGAWWWAETAPCYWWPSAWSRQTRTAGGATHPASPEWMMRGNTWENHTHGKTEEWAQTNAEHTHSQTHTTLQYKSGDQSNILSCERMTRSQRMRLTVGSFWSKPSECGRLSCKQAQRRSVKVLEKLSCCYYFPWWNKNTCCTISVLSSPINSSN